MTRRTSDPCQSLSLSLPQSVHRRLDALAHAYAYGKRLPTRHASTNLARELLMLALSAYEEALGLTPPGVPSCLVTPPLPTPDGSPGSFTAHMPVLPPPGYAGSVPMGEPGFTPRLTKPRKPRAVTIAPTSEPAPQLDPTIDPATAHLAKANFPASPHGLDLNEDFQEIVREQLEGPRSAVSAAEVLAAPFVDPFPQFAKNA